jgi:hypothetical protein
MDVEEIVLQHMTVLAAPAARAAAISPSGWPSLLNAVGASNTGNASEAPNSSLSVDA